MMSLQTDTMSCRFRYGTISAVFLLLTYFDGGRSQLTGRPQPLLAMVGDDITLPCHVKTATDAVNEMLEWSRHDLNPRFVHTRRFGEDRLVDQNPFYKGRTSVYINRLKQGDMSLKLSKVKLSDEGTYRCFVPGLNTESTVQLTVGAVIKIATVSSGVLECESKGWYPEPEVLWLDSEGNLLSAGPTETVRGPDDLYTVSSRVTVEKRHSNNITCRVQQKNQSRQAAIHVPDDFFTESSSSSTSAIIGVVVGILFILVVALVAWKWKQNNARNKKSHKDEENQRGGERKSDNNDSEQQCLIEKETDREEHEAKKETIKSLEKEEEPGHSCQIEQETNQERRSTETETNNTPVLRNEKVAEQSAGLGTESSCVTDDERQQGEIQKEGEAMNDSDDRDKDTRTKSNSEETGSHCTAERGTHQQQPPGGEENTVLEETEKTETLCPTEDKRDGETEAKPMNAEKPDQGQRDGDGQQQKVTEGGEATNGHKKENEVKTQSQCSTDEKTQQNDHSPAGETKNNCEKIDNAEAHDLT